MFSLSLTTHGHSQKDEPLSTHHRALTQSQPKVSGEDSIATTATKHVGRSASLRQHNQGNSCKCLPFRLSFVATVQL